MFILQLDFYGSRKTRLLAPVSLRGARVNRPHPRRKPAIGIVGPAQRPIMGWSGRAPAPAAALCRIKRLNGACSHYFGPRIVGLPDHSPEFAVQQSASVQETAWIALSRKFSTASCARQHKTRRVPEMVESCPQLKHLASPFVGPSTERNFLGRGPPCQSLDISTRIRGANASAQSATRSGMQGLKLRTTCGIHRRGR